MTSLVYQPISQLSTLNFGASTYLPPYNLPARLPRRCARNPTLGAREVTSGGAHHQQQPPACCIALRRSKAHGVERLIKTKILFVRFNGKRGFGNCLVGGQLTRGAAPATRRWVRERARRHLQPPPCRLAAQLWRRVGGASPQRTPKSVKIISYQKTMTMSSKIPFGDPLTILSRVSSGPLAKSEESEPSLFRVEVRIRVLL